MDILVPSIKVDQERNFKNPMSNRSLAFPTSIIYSDLQSYISNCFSSPNCMLYNYGYLIHGRNIDTIPDKTS